MFVGFLQLAARLLIGAQARRVYCSFCAQLLLLYELESLSFDLQHQGHGSLGPVLSARLKSSPVHCLHRVGLWHARLS